MSARGIPAVPDGSEPGHRAPAMAHAEHRGTGRNLARRVERLFTDEKGWRCSRVPPGRDAARAQFLEVSPAGTSTCSTDLFSSFPDSLYRRAL
jgi:hypothetical protein